MAGRFPYESPGRQGQQQQLNSAQVRAALAGLGGVDEALFLQRQQEIQREIREMMLREQLDAQSKYDNMLQEQKLRAIGEQLKDFPDLQQHYRNILINEQLQRQDADPRSLFLSEQLRLRSQEERLWLQRQQEEQQRNMLLKEQLLRQQEEQQAFLREQALGLHGLRRPQLDSQLETTAAASAASAAGAVNSPHLRDLAAASLAGNAIKKTQLERKRSSGTVALEDMEPAVKRLVTAEPREQVDLDRKPTAKPRPMLAPPGPSIRSPMEIALEEKLTATDVEMKIIRDSIFNEAKAGAIDLQTVPAAAAAAVAAAAAAAEASMAPLEGSKPSAGNSSVSSPPSTAPSPVVEIIRLGDIGQLIAAAESEQKSDDAAATLATFKQVEWSESESDDDDSHDFKIASEKGETIELPGFRSALPQLPQEVIEEGSENEYSEDENFHDMDVDKDENTAKKESDKKSGKHDGKEESRSRIIPSLHDLGYPIDTWWPSTTSIRRERRSNAYQSDEDEFADPPGAAFNGARFRANLPVVQARLEKEVEPGVLEKIPHCKIHRMRMKRRKYSSAPEFVYCWQVTEIYLNDIMVCCSVCGTWRHAACGGHYKPYSTRDCSESPFTAICDRCHEEEEVIRNYPQAKKRIGRQRAEQLRRALATSAVMRQASFSKHGGTYKWPLGSVSATHIGGHTRSVHSRHDKAERQWSEMATRLGRGYGYRPKERVKVRTKELERLLVSVEDAEGFTDRHNMLLFLMRDTARDHPVGFENPRRNIFDPEDDMFSSAYCLPVDNDKAEKGPNEDTNSGTGDEEKREGENAVKNEALCAREGCQRKHRFDSLFCSDSCGVSSLEGDLLRSFQYASDIHPSLMRN